MKGDLWFAAKCLLRARGAADMEPMAMTGAMLEAEFMLSVIGFFGGFAKDDTTK